MRIIYTMFIALLLIGIASAEVQTLPTQKQYSPAILVQTCDSCTYVNLEAIKYPNSSVQYLNSPMEINGNTFIYQFNDTSQLGDYIVTTCGDVSGTNTCVDYDFHVTVTGKDTTSSQAAIYITLLIMSIFIFGLCIYAGMAIPYGNSRDEMTGYVIAVSNKKYLKIFSWVLAYLCLTIIIYFSWMLSFAYLDFNFVSSLFQFLFYALVAGIIPLFVVGTFILIANAVRDHKVADMLSGGFRVR